MKEYRVERQTAPVTLRLKDGSEVAGRMFVPPEPEDDPTVNKLYLLLNSYDSFVPLEVGDGEVVLQNKDLVAWCRYEGEAGPVLEVVLPRRRVTLRMMDGSVLCGDIVADGPPHRRRVLDCLNQAAPFVLLETTEGDYMVRKDCIAAVPSGELGDPRPSGEEAFEVEAAPAVC